MNVRYALGYMALLSSKTMLLGIYKVGSTAKKPATAQVYGTQSTHYSDYTSPK